MGTTKTNLNKTNDDSQLASLMYEQAIKHIEAIEYEIQEIEFNGCKDNDKLYSLLAIQNKAIETANKLYEYAVN
jgi:hypothetical protein